MPALVVSAAVMIEDAKVLLTQRPGGSHLETLWEFPGGKLEEGESPAEALVRELREELGIESVVHDVVDVTFWRYPKRDVLLLFYRATRTSGVIQHLGVAAHAWVSRDQLDAYPMPPADVAVVAKVKALLG